jgi:type 1 glutamine amidotransferase
VETTDLFIPFLERSGFRVLVEDCLEVYEDEEFLARTDLIVQCWAGGELTPPESERLIAAVRAGTGLAGWHGGILDTFRETPAYQALTGGQFVMHPPNPGRHRVHLSAERADHPVVAGLGDFDVDAEPYWTLSDPLNDVLATMTVDADETRSRAAAIPAVWTRTWGKGRVFVSTIGHGPDDFESQEVRTITERGLLWASR